MHKKTIICLSGGMEVGKTSSANFLIDCDFEEIGFADHLKCMCMEVFDMDTHDVYHTDGKKRKFNIPKELTPDKLLQLIQYVHDFTDYRITFNKLIELSKFASTCKKMETPREVLQIIGTDLCRNILDKDYHVKATLSQIQRSDIDRWVISDGRFKNERDSVRELGGYNVLLVDEEKPNYTGTHESERDLGDHGEYDYILYSNKIKGLGDLEEKVYNMLLDLQVEISL